MSCWRGLPLGVLTEIQEELPSPLLSRRPDLRSAEYNLRASLANVDVVRRSFYPAFALRGPWAAARCLVC